MAGTVGGTAEFPSMTYKQCTGACGHAYAFRGTMLASLGAQSVRTIEHVRLGREATDPQTSLCEPYVACIHDPFGAYEILRQGCNHFAGGWIDGVTGLGPTVLREPMQYAAIDQRDGIVYPELDNIPKPIHLPKLKQRWLLSGVKVCGNLYGSDLQSPCKQDHIGLFYQNRDLLKSDQNTNCNM